MSQLASPILKGQGVNVDDGLKPTLVDFNATSTARLAEADPRLRGFMTEVEKRANSQGINMQIAEAKRTADRQAELVAAGTSPTMNSNHLTGNAADIYLVGPDGKPNYNIADYQPVADIAKEVAAEQGLTDFQWGGDWKSKDAVHFQLGGSPNLNTTVSTMGAPDAAAGGALPQTVEGILSSLYPDSTEAEKTAHRKDIWRGLSQGLSAMSQGRPVDLSNIATNADARRRQNVLDMRERDRARAGAALIYSQTGDADMAGAVAGGLMSLNDVFSERERKRLAEQADAQRLKTEQANKALGGLVLGMTGSLGFDEKRTAEIAAALDAGADPSTVLTLTEQAKVADEARKKEEQTAAAAERRAAVAEEYVVSEDPVLRLTGQLLLSDPNMTVAEGYKLASDRFPVAKDGADKGYEFEAKIATRMENLNEPRDVATRAVLDEAKTAGMTNLTIGPDGMITVTQNAPTATGGAPAAGNAPAATGIGGAFEAQFGTPAPGYVTAMGPNGLQTVPVPGAPQVAANEADLATKQADLTAKLQANREKAATETDTLALSTLAVEAADLQNQLVASQIAQINADKTTDSATKQATLAKLNSEAMIAKKTYDDAVVASEQAKVDAEKQSSNSYVNADRQFAVFEDSAKEVMAHGLDAMTTGLMGQVVGKVGGYVVDQTPRSDFLAKVGTMGSQLMLDALSELKAAGVALTPVTDTDLQVAGKSATLLSDPSALSGETIVKETAFQTNYMKDALYGPKDLTRYDEFGQPYKVGQSSLGVTEDTFARHWMSIPPTVKEAWRAGKIATLPTDDPNYAEAAKVINALESNFKLYQPDAALDRSIVGIPAPEGVAVEDWPSIWAGLSDKARAELTKAAK
jgi:peptidoglycan L-alanyl-D-glutamate endopeptidase CwlK